MAHSTAGAATLSSRRERSTRPGRKPTEVLRVVQCFSAVTKIAGQLHLQSDWTHFLPHPRPTK